MISFAHHHVSLVWCCRTTEKQPDNYHNLTTAPTHTCIRGNGLNTHTVVEADETLLFFFVFSVSPAEGTSSDLTFYQVAAAVIWNWKDSALWFLWPFRHRHVPLLFLDALICNLFTFPSSLSWNLQTLTLCFSVPCRMSHVPWSFSFLLMTNWNWMW